ncbi:MAG TPA: hypothetical protein VH302_16420 [Bryobacteraceae bacterium]|nr:hypothetical protein [Bryobacteraceae bacterium]
MLLLILIGFVVLFAAFISAPARLFAALSSAFCLSIFALARPAPNKLSFAASISPVIAIPGFLLLVAASIWLLWIARRARRNKVSDL